ncbi:follicle cell protein 3C-1 [Venturia canescens]|uniref:follicle cell protein 3C-1 n=1 Tax=Venturia canescens TaxID=32260 RepID=UPI001C9C1802|nr:follicle cell protein 3C-1 [Venturia canescens]XP_043275370.1 follicle cell protein 3C-1 [Venturia canescens]XP_043275371.1 follicle cell protein 3C-1 [Venturia canescens]XP_043275372.1 follicle cell protein 3C-1 [Venturia canescens]
MRLTTLFIFMCVYYVRAKKTDNSTEIAKEKKSAKDDASVGCVCGVFLTGQMKRGSKDPPNGNPALLHEHGDAFACTNLGNKLCTNKCLDAIVKHLPNSPTILCGAIDRDAYKERAYLFIKNCKDEWINTNLSAGREYCCKDSVPYKCPIMS